ncbi:hypothetical protein [Agromyces sp. NPDC058104]|uniref:hypothetical protein n=1 Tax=Agromyces sp. NPDC058104 TaxID=3346342 RepID=UPI0036D770CC
MNALPESVDPRPTPTAGAPSAAHARSSLAGAVAVVIVIALQVAVPLVLALQPPPRQYGFQMYSGLGAATVTWFDAQGDEHAFTDFDDVVAKHRPDIDWTRGLPEAVCAHEPTAVEVRVAQSGRERGVECD